MSRSEQMLLAVAQQVARWRARLGPAQSWLGQADFPLAAQPDEERKRVRVAAIQFPVRAFHSARDYATECYLWTRQAVDAGAQLIVFPELVGFVPLLGLLPGIEEQAQSQLSGSAHGESDLLKSVTRLMAPVASRVYRFVFQNLARRFQVHIAAGSAIVASSDGTLKNVAFLFGPDGYEMGHQPKTHFYGLEFGMGLTRGGFVQVYDTPVGKLACPVCMDHTYFETARIAYMLGAEILLDPAADTVIPYNWWYQLRGIWGRVQESPSYGVHSMMVGKALGMEFSGRTSIFGPVELVGADGIMTSADTSDQGEIVVADLDLDALRQYRRDLPVQPRYDWCARQLAAAYATASEKRGSQERG